MLSEPPHHVSHSTQARKLQPLSSNYFVEQSGELKVLEGVR